MTLTEAYSCASNHRRQIEASTLVGCFYCLSVYPAAQLRTWIDGGNTAVCARCDVDSVLGDALLGGSIKRHFLEKMQARWFSDAATTQFSRG